jgi:hypothetical protein
MTTKNIITLIALVIIISTVAWFSGNKSKIEIPEVENVEMVPTITYNNSSTDLIVVDAPLPGGVVGGVFDVMGVARGYWFFEASFPVELYDLNNSLLTTGIAQAQGDWMTEDFVPFSVSMTVPNNYTGPATLVLRRDNPSGEPANDASISFAVNIQ